MRRWLSQERGAALVELALVVPMLLFLAVALWEFGRVLDAQLVVNNAAREGARYASLGRSASEVQSRVAAYMTEGLGSRISGSGDVTFNSNNVQVTNAKGTVGSPVDVTVPVTIKFFAGSLIDMPATIQLAGTATMRLECGGSDPC